MTRRSPILLALLYVFTLVSPSSGEILEHRISGRRFVAIVRDVQIGGKTLVVTPTGVTRYVDLTRYRVVPGTERIRPDPAKPPLVYAFRVQDDFGTSAYAAKHYPDALRGCLARAAAAGAAAVVIPIDSKGGPAGPALEMAERLAKESRVLTVAVVGTGDGNAYSAATLIAMGCDVIVMSPGATIGAAAPVAADGHDLPGDTRAKWSSAVSAKFRARA